MDYFVHTRIYNLLMFLKMHGMRNYLYIFSACTVLTITLVTLFHTIDCGIAYHVYGCITCMAGTFFWFLPVPLNKNSLWISIIFLDLCHCFFLLREALASQTIFMAVTEKVFIHTDITWRTLRKMVAPYKMTSTWELTAKCNFNNYHKISLACWGYPDY